MAGKPKPMSQIKQLLRLHKRGVKIKPIARETGLSKNTVKTYLSKLTSLKFSIEDLLLMDDPILEKLFFSGNPAYKDTRYDALKAEFPYFEQELKKTGVSKYVLWEEYRQKEAETYGYSQFCHHLYAYLKNKKPSLHLEHLPGEKLFVDFAGKTLSYIRKDTVELVECQVFVACLPYSDYSFCMAVESQAVPDFIHALVACVKYLGGAPKVLVPDNLKSAVIKADRYEPSINQSLEDFANHYGMTVLPARAAKPQDKALVENQVKLIYSRVYAKIRNRQFFSLEELNQTVSENIKLHNQTRMQQKNYCREEFFLSEEKPHLQALPAEDFELKYYAEYKVAKNNHIYLGQDKHYYSVPYAHIGKQAKVIYTRNLVKIYIDGQKVAVHRRDFGTGKYTTEKAHLCSAHQHYLDRSPDYYIGKAEKIDAVFKELTENIFKQNKYPEQLYRSCDGIFSLQRKTDRETFLRACKIALELQNYTYGFILNLIKNNMTDSYIEKPSQVPLPEHQNVRGREYYK